MRFSEGYCPKGLELASDHSGAEALLAECARQHRDALATVASQRAAAARVAAPIAASGRVMLLGMGASHCANQIGAARLRTLGIAATAMPASEALYSPRPGDEPVILTSQSGKSGEVVRWLADNGPDRVVGALTLNPDRPFGPVRTLVADGGLEQAFAATRSFTLTIALFSAILEALGAGDADRIPDREPEVHPAVEPAITAVSAAEAFAYSGRAAFEGMAAMAALSTSELGRTPAFALEGGQLRHGPVEMFSPRVAVVLFRPAGASAHAWNDNAEIAVRAGAPLVVFDASGEPPLPGASTISVPVGEGLGAAYELAPSQQAFTLGLSAMRVADVGQPGYCTKVTDTE